MRKKTITEYQHLHHTFGPVYNDFSSILILGSFPSIQSRQSGFYYENAHNRFWKILGEIFGEATPNTASSKTAFLLIHGIALWDIVESCDIKGSADSSIKHVKPNNINFVLEKAPIKKILLNGKKAATLYGRFCKDIKIPAVAMPSTSPANASWSAPKLIEVWSKEIIGSAEGIK